MGDGHSDGNGSACVFANYSANRGGARVVLPGSYSHHITFLWRFLQMVINLGLAATYQLYNPRYSDLRSNRHCIRPIGKLDKPLL